MDNNKLKQILEILEKIKKKQESLKKNLKDIGEFIKASFKEQNDNKNKALIEKEEKIKKQLEKYLKSVYKEISNQIEKDLPFKNDSKNDKDKNEDNNSNEEIEIDDKKTEKYFKSRVIDISSEEQKSYRSDKEEERKEKEEKEKKKQKKNKEKINLQFISKDIEKKYKFSELEHLYNISFRITIKNMGNTKIPDKTYIRFENKNSIFWFKRKIDELSISEEKSYSIKLDVNGEEIKKKFSNGYETKIIFSNKEYEIDFEPIKFKFIVQHSNESDSDNSNNDKLEKKNSNNFNNHNHIRNKDPNIDNNSNSDDEMHIPSENNNGYNDNQYFNNNLKNTNYAQDSHQYIRNKKVELQGEELKKFRDELEIKYYISNIPKNDKDIIRKINQYIEDYNKYCNEKNKENKAKLFDNLIEKIGDDLAFVETKIS